MTTKLAKKPGKKQKENRLGCTGEGKRLKGNLREGSKEGKPRTVLKLSYIYIYISSFCHNFEFENISYLPVIFRKQYFYCSACLDSYQIQFGNSFQFVSKT